MTPLKGVGVVKVTAKPPPIPDRPRSLVRIDTEPEPSRIVRSKLVGRADALVTLREIVGRAIDFQAPQLVTIVGNQGTGKTRLINELIAEVREVTGGGRAATRGGDRRCRVFHGAAERDADGGFVKLATITSLLRDRFELTPNPDDASRLRFSHEIKTVMTADPVAEMLHFLGAFVGLEFPPTPFLRAVMESTKQHDELARIALRRFVELDATQSPLVLVLDDLQWADDETLALISDLASNLSGSPIVLLAASRPEMLERSGGWGDGALDHTRIDLRNLEQDEAEVMFRNLLSRCKEIPEDTAQSAVEMTGGNPAFLEQLVRLFMDNGTIDASGAIWTLDPDMAAETELPISIEEAIEARIAALESEERDLLEKAAVFGNVFWVSAVIALTRLERPPEPSPPGPLDIEWGNGEDVRRRISI